MYSRKRVSIIIPVFNVLEYLDECLNSVITQTYEELEIIVVDDGSTDGSGAKCDEWAQKDNRITVIHKANGGVSSARNAGMKAARGDYIGFVDSDDWIDPNMYDHLVSAIGDADIVCCGYVDYPMGTMDLPVKKGIKETKPCGIEEAYIHIYEKNGYFMSIWNKLFSRDALIQNGSIIEMDTSIIWGEDELWLTCVMANCRKVAFVPEALYYWRPRTSSVTRVKALTKRHMTLFEAKQKTMERLPHVKSIQELYRSVTFNDCFYMKIMAYYSNDREKLERISSILKPMKRSWLWSKNITLVRKIKVLLLEAEMALHLPRTLVWQTDRMRQYGVIKNR